MGNGGKSDRDARRLKAAYGEQWVCDVQKASALRLLIVASIMLVAVACSRPEEFDRRVNSADDNYMSDLARALDSAGVDFRAQRDGSITYRSRDEDKFRAIDERVKRDIAATTTKRAK